MNTVITKFQEANIVYERYGLRGLARQSLDSRFYQYLYETDASAYTSPLDPFKIVWVDLDRINRITGRMFPT